jgi:3-oxoacyl-[acyl-carrier protein] reductase
MPLEGKVAFVSGASRPGGIGSAIVHTLADKGADVAITYKSNREGAQSLVEEIKKLGRRAFAVGMDVSEYSSVKEGLALVKKELGPVNILVNNAALMGHNVPIYKTTAEEWDYEVKVCLNSAFYCIKEVWADMCENKYGRIVNISSVAGPMGGYAQTSYGAAKAGLISLAKSVALEGARFNITSNAILVGLANTAATRNDLTEEAQKKVSQRTVWRRPAEPQEIANAVAFAVSNEAGYMTGAVLNMLGGMDLFLF